MFFNSVEHAIYQNGALFAGQLLLPDGFVPWTLKKVVPGDDGVGNAVNCHTAIASRFRAFAKQYIGILAQLRPALCAIRF